MIVPLRAVILLLVQLLIFPATHSQASISTAFNFLAADTLSAPFEHLARSFSLSQRSIAPSPTRPAFSLASPTSPPSSSLAIRTFIQQPNTHGVLTEEFFSADDSDCGDEDSATCRKVAALPLFLRGYTVIYHLPEDPGDSSMVFTTELVADIFARRRTHWNDSLLAELNPTRNLSSLHEPFVPLFVASDAYRHVASSLLDRVLADAARPRSNEAFVWDAPGDSPSATTGSRLALLLESVPYGIALVSHGVVLESQCPQVGRMLNRAGRTVELSDASVQAAGISTPPSVVGFASTIVVNDGSVESWPLCTYVYAVLPTASIDADGDDFCTSARAFSDLLVWSMTEDSASSLLKLSYGFTSMPLSSRDRSVVLFTSKLCDSQLLATGTASPVSGSGSTFAAGLYSELMFLYRFVRPDVAVSYVGVGSSAGKAAIVARQVDFAGSDSELSGAQRAAGGDLSFMPVVAGAIVIIYNVAFDGEPPLFGRLVVDREVAADIFEGTLFSWRDPRLLALNPSFAAALPDANITVVHRADGSGTTSVFTTALSSFSPAFAATHGIGSAISWDVDAMGRGVAAIGNGGVSVAVLTTPNSVGYVGLDYARSNGLVFAKMINAHGSVVDATAESLQSAMSDRASSGLVTDLVDAPGSDSWPISTYTYMIYHNRTMSDCNTGRIMLEFWQWVATDALAQSTAAELGFAIPPAVVRDQVLADYEQATCDGEPLLSNCPSDDFVYNAEAKRCQCRAGYVHVDAQTCRQCPAGSFTDVPGQYSCTLCDDTGYQPTAGSTSCISCPDLSRGFRSGQVSVSECLCISNTYDALSNGKVDGSDAIADMLTSKEHAPVCRSCPDGAYCAGGTNHPVPQRGWWASSSNPELMFACESVAACPGGAHDTCGENFVGDLCTACKDDYFKYGSTCSKCPDSLAIRVCAAIAVLALMCIVPLIVTRRRFHLITSVAVFLQVVNSFSVLRLNWPSAATDMFDRMSSVRWMLYGVNYSPECSVQSDYFVGFLFDVFAPLTMMITTLLVQGAKTTFNCARLMIKYRNDDEESVVSASPVVDAPDLEAQQGGLAPQPLQTLGVPTGSTRLSVSTSASANVSSSSRTRSVITPQSHARGLPVRAASAGPLGAGRARSNAGGHHRRHRSRVARVRSEVIRQSKMSLSSAISASIAQLYLFVSQATTLQYFDCTQSADGVWRLDAQPSVHCFEGRWNAYLPAAVVAALFHLVLVPGALVYLLWRTRKAPTRRRLRPRFDFLYGRYKPQLHYWEIFLLLRKLVIFSVVQFLSHYPQHAASIAIVVLAVSAAAQWRFSPMKRNSANRLEAGLLVAACIILLQVSQFASGKGDPSIEQDDPAYEASLLILLTIGYGSALVAVLFVLVEACVLYHVVPPTSKLGLWFHRRAVHVTLTEKRGLTGLGLPDALRPGTPSTPELEVLRARLRRRGLRMDLVGVDSDSDSSVCDDPADSPRQDAALLRHRTDGSTGMFLNVGSRSPSIVRRGSPRVIRAPSGQMSAHPLGVPRKVGGL